MLPIAEVVTDISLGQPTASWALTCMAIVTVGDGLVSCKCSPPPCWPQSSGLALAGLGRIESEPSLRRRLVVSGQRLPGRAGGDARERFGCLTRACLTQAPVNWPDVGSPLRIRELLGGPCPGNRR